MLMLFLAVLYVDKEAAQLQPHVFGIYILFALFFLVYIFWAAAAGLEIRVEVVTI
jgi:hypothetical protein